ncbi:hypothetical protein N2152v2_001458 [Parachlorella kessleri]
MAAQFQAPTVAVGQFVQAQQTTTQAAQAVEQAVAGLPPPDAAFQQQVLQTLQQVQAQVQQVQMQQAQMQQQMLTHQQQMRVDFCAVSNSVARLHNSRGTRNQVLQWLHNAQGQLPAHAPITRRSITEVVLQQVNGLLQHYGLLENANQMHMGVMDRRFLLLEHLGAEALEGWELAAAAANQ